jgi:hypothetical protein
MCSLLSNSFNNLPILALIPGTYYMMRDSTSVSFGVDNNPPKDHNVHDFDIFDIPILYDDLQCI